MGHMPSHGLGPTRAKVLDALQQSSAPLTATDVAERLDLHPNSARHHLGQLVSAGFAERAPIPTHTTGRPRVGFSASLQAPPVSNQHLIELTTVLLEHFCSDDESAVAVGAAWGRQLREERPTLDGVVEAMGESGFAPDIGGEFLTFGRCPFRERMSPDTLHAVCQVHLGYLQGAMPENEFGEFEIGRVCRIAVSSKSEPTG